ncbi:hypothetical protein PACTADRAFT_50862 [Pachysolen tannophilus NRRL Y-2460]|uniref:Actin-binding protein n=1 Tax=Pachysolen tannophilus NRRL Y-2460 TaxID=669874 RepID=A0A1E4TTN6_PACTA|nr:hypothetical protein PACTADRAFT_50862 [Pachysolen tannophilus NRRL Y-2460]
MEKLDLATFSKEIKEDYNRVVTSSEDSYTVFTVDANSALKPTGGDVGGIADFVSEFEDGKVQFGLAKVTAPGSDVKKLLLLGWCPENCPLKSKISFGANFGEVSKVLRGYHVQITARDADDLDVNDILKTISDAAGARYSIQSLSTASNLFSKSSSPKAKIAPTPISSSSVSKPVSASKPAPPTKAKPSSRIEDDWKIVSKEDADEWDGEAETEVRDFNKKPLENLPSAYKPTKVNIEQLRKGKNDTISSTPVTKSRDDEVSTKKEENLEPESLNERIKSFSIKDNDTSSNGRLTSLPRPSTSHTVSSRYHEVKAPSFGTKPPTPYSLSGKHDNKVIGGASRDFGAENGKTPAQIWAEKHGKFKSVEPEEKDNNVSTKSFVEPEEKTEYVSTEAEDEAEETKNVHIGDIKARLAQESKKSEEEQNEFSPPPVAARHNIASSFTKPSEDEEKEENEEKVEPQQETFSRPPLAEHAQDGVKEERAVPPPPARQEPDETSQHKAIAEYSYDKDEDNEISFEEGELIVNIVFADEDWWKGTNSKGETGLFPSSYVKLADAESAKEEPKTEESHEPGVSSGKDAIADYDYDATEDNELTFKEGDLITDIEFIDEDWWLGTFGADRKLFPANYVTLKE